MIWLYIELVLFALLLVTAPYQLWCDYLGVMALPATSTGQTVAIKITACISGLNSWTGSIQNGLTASINKPR